MNDNSSLRYQIVNTGTEFEGMREEWSELLNDSDAGSVFLTWEWQFSWWEIFGGELHIVRVQIDNLTVGISPLHPGAETFFPGIKVYWCAAAF